MARKKIGDLLLERGYITQAQLDEALRDQSLGKGRLGEVLVNKGYITEDQLIDTIADRLSIPRLNLGMMVIDPSIIDSVPVDVARRYSLIPVFSIGNTLTLAMADPLNIIAIDEIRYLTGSDIKRAISSITEIKEAINHYYSVADAIGGIVGYSKLEDTAGISLASLEASDETETPVVKLVNLIINKAVKAGASDIHIEPDETVLRVRFRISGVMREEAAPPKALQSEIISRIKIAAELDVSEKRMPQDGRYFVLVDEDPIDLRVSTLPTIHGEKIVIRILDRKNLRLTFPDLGFRKKVLESWLNVIRKPEGLILISGPTSSGKTSTLYSTLQEINSIEKNIITVEDPVEYNLELINQIQINEKAGLTFPSTLRAMLRQNPDVIMIGEIRDKETAGMAVRSALTGHLVFSTIHTNDAASSITRLIDMGVERYLVATALKGVLAQRLVRVNCPKCSREYTPSEKIIKRAGLTELADVLSFKRGEGCIHCKRTGFSGRTGLYEFIEVNPTIEELILGESTLGAVRESARGNGFIPLFEAGLEKMESGQVCLEELLKETSNIEDYFGTASLNANRKDYANQVQI